MVSKIDERKVSKKRPLCARKNDKFFILKFSKSAFFFLYNVLHYATPLHYMGVVGRDFVYFGRGRMKKIGLMLALVCVATGMYADTIKTLEGDVINGTITLVKGGVVTIDTAFAGTLNIDREQILHIEYTDADKATFYARTDATQKAKEEVNLSKDLEGNVILIPTEDKTKALALSDVSTLWPTTATDPDFPPKKLWAYSASLGVTGHSGSSNDLSFMISGDAVRTTDTTTLKLYASYYKARSEGVETAKQFIAGFDLEHRPWERHSWYVRDEVQHNPYSNYQIRNVIAAGYGLYVWNTVTDGRTSLLRLRAGLADTYTKYHRRGANGQRVTDNDIALDFGVLFHYDFTSGIGWNTEITYTPLIEDLTIGTIVHESKLTYTLSELAVVNDNLDNIALEAGVRNEYQTRPQPGTCHTDTTWYLRLSKTW